MANNRDTFLLLDNASATGDAVDWRGGRGTFMVYGTFSSTSASLQFSPDDGTTWIDAGSETTKTANGGGNFELPPCKIRAALTGGTPSAMYAKAVGLGT